jgi:hypothetical protein
LFYSECAALVKQGKVYGVGTEDMDVSEISLLFEDTSESPTGDAASPNYGICDTADFFLFFRL